MLHTVTARQIQKEYKRIFDRVKETQEPIIVISNSKPIVAIVSLDFLDKTEPKKSLKALEQEARKAMKDGEVEIIDTREKLEKHFKEIDQYAKE